MFGLKLSTANSCLLTISLFCLTSPCSAKYLPLEFDLPLPPVPESKDITAQLEILLQNGTSIGCSTKEYVMAALFKGIIGNEYLWTTFNVYIDPAFNIQERTLINNAIIRLQEAVACLLFGIYPPVAKPSGDYVHIKKANGCWSYVGRIGGAQELGLQSPGCMSVGLIMHELIHALGFYHEQSRPDRDDFVNILWHNIQPGREPNFNKYNLTQLNTYGVPYNQRGIMHYGAGVFSRNEQPTITAKNGGEVGMTGDLEQTDIDKLRKMYNC